MSKLVFSDGSEVLNLEYAATNTINGQLVLQVNECLYEFDLFKDREKTSILTWQSDEGEIIKSFSGYTTLTLIYINIDAGNTMIWLRKE